MPTLLVIDDDPLICHLFRKTFQEADVTLLLAGSAGEGLEQVSGHRPDVVILDINLPDVSGLEAFRQLRQLDARVPVIFITSDDTTDTAIEAMKLGAYDYLLKPLDTTRLRELVARAFEISRLVQVPVVVAEARPARADVLVGRCPAMRGACQAIG